MQRLRSIDEGIRNQALVEGGQLPAVCAGEREEIAVGYLSGIQRATAVHTLCVKERDVVGPEFVIEQ